MLGLDIDAALVEMARRTSWARTAAAADGEADGEVEGGSEGCTDGEFISSDGRHGAEWVSRFSDPHVFFRREDFVQDAHDDGGYDAISCFSVSKWMHLHHGDEGLKAVFMKVYSLLNAGGCFILEPQPWSSYRKNKGSSEAARTNLADITMRPEMFADYLTGNIGFSRCDALGAPSPAVARAAPEAVSAASSGHSNGSSPGKFQARPVYVFWK